MFKENNIVDNRVFLLGLDKLYRDAMKRHERGELLICARRLAEVLHVTAAAVPVEGYYAEDRKLTEYFRLVRALQDLSEDLMTAVASLGEFRRLRAVMSSPLYGRPQQGGKLLSVGRDALSQALLDTLPEWNVQRLTATAYAVARETNDISLVGLAARAQDSVVLTATRESVVLYAEVEFGSALPPGRPKYIWKVDKDLAEQARRFIETFNTLFNKELPSPEPPEAERYWHAYQDNEILGRCVRIGSDDSVSPMRHYHWAICLRADGTFEVQEFWHSEVWTTERYRSALRHGVFYSDLKAPTVL